MKYSLILIAVLTISTMTQAADDYKIIFHGISHHLNPGDAKINEKNTTFAIEIPDTPKGFATMGAYRDSQNTVATYISYTNMYYTSKYVRAGMVYGLVQSDGYTRITGLSVIPLSLPVLELRIPNEPLQLNILFKPVLIDGDTAFIGIQFKYHYGH